MDINKSDKRYSDAIGNQTFVPFWKAHVLAPNIMNQKDQMFTLYKDYPTLAKHLSFIAGSNVCHLSKWINQGK